MRSVIALAALALLVPTATAFGLPPEPGSPPQGAGEAVAWTILYSVEVLDYGIDTTGEAAFETLTAFGESTDYTFCVVTGSSTCVVSLDASFEGSVYYVELGRTGGDAAGVWQESNGCPGLQRSAEGACAADQRLA